MFKNNHICSLSDEQKELQQQQQQQQKVHIFVAFILPNFPITHTWTENGSISKNLLLDFDL